MFLTRFCTGAAIALGTTLTTGASASPVFPIGTIFVEDELITSADPSTFQSATANGTGTRNMFDRRVTDFADYNVYLFNAVFSNGFSMEIQVNDEFGSVAAAQAEADFYGFLIGQLPSVLLTDINEVWIHQGVQPFGGGNNSILIHTGQSASYIADGILEETLVHEASHTSLDGAHATSAGWQQAQTDDGDFVSPYARDNPIREDIAETFLMYLGARHLSDRMNPADVAAIEAGIPNRLAYFDAQQFDLGPIVDDAAVVPLPAGGVLVISGLGVLAGLSRRRKTT